MGVWTLEGTLDGTTPAAVLFDSCSMRAFGPAFDDADAVESFLEFARVWGHGDVRALSPHALDALHEEWLSGRDDDGDLAPLLEASIALRGKAVPR